MKFIKFKQEGHINHIRASDIKNFYMGAWPIGCVGEHLKGYRIYLSTYESQASVYYGLIFNTQEEAQAELDSMLGELEKEE